MRQNVGEYYLIDAYRNCVMRTDIDLEQVGRELGALAPHETLAE